MQPVGLVERIRNIEAAYGWNTRQTAEWLGLSREMWSMVKAGETRFGGRSLKTLRRKHPDFAPFIDAYLAEDAA